MIRGKPQVTTSDSQADYLGALLAPTVTDVVGRVVNLLVPAILTGFTIAGGIIGVLIAAAIIFGGR